jgi:hypothetical protein
MKKIHLLPNHRRSLSVTADAIDRSLREMEEVLRERGSEEVTKKILPVYSEAERQNLLQAIDEIRKENQAMVEHLNLERSKFAEDQIINSRVSHLWTILVDSKSRKLKNFGEVPKDVAPEIDCHVDKLLEILKQMM